LVDFGLLGLVLDCGHQVLRVLFKRQNKSTSTTATWLGQKAIKEPVDFIDRLGDCPESTLAISAMLFLPLLAVAVEFWLEIPGQKPGWASVFALGSGWRRWLERA